MPDAGWLDLKVDGTKISIVFRDPYLSHHSHNIKDLGSGVEQIVLTLVAGIAHELPATIAIEEPETGLHPGAQRAVLALLREWASGSQILVTTHSSVMLDGEAGKGCIYLVKRRQGESALEPVQKDFAATLTDLGVRLSDVLSADRILLVEGPSDRDVLSIWFPRLATDPKVVIIPGQGGDNARFASLLAEWLSHADRLGSRKVLYLRDRDELNHASLARLDVDAAVYILERRELENYLLDPAALAKAFGSIAPAVGPALTAEQIGADIKAAAESLRHIVILKRVCRSLEPIRLVDNETRRALAAERADVNRLIDVVVGRIPEPEAVAERIRSLWNEEEVDIDATWGSSWWKVVPGADVLDAIFRQYSVGKYRKVEHGAAIAKEFAEPPQELRDVISEFLA